MARPTLVLTVCAALLCVSLTYARPASEGPQERDQLGCQVATNNARVNLQNLQLNLRLLGQSAQITIVRLQACARQLNLPNLALTCLRNLGQDDQRDLQLKDQQFMQQLEQLVQQVSRAATECVSGAAGGLGGASGLGGLGG